MSEKTNTVTVSVVVPYWLSHTGKTRRKDAQVDPGVAEIVRRLNHPIFGDKPITEAACDGHGDSYPSITLVDGTVMLIVPEAEVARLTE